MSSPVSAQHSVVDGRGGVRKRGVGAFSARGDVGRGVRSVGLNQLRYCDHQECGGGQQYSGGV